MKKLFFKKIDAFATATSGGNPAGYVRLDGPDGLTAHEMQTIARQLQGFVNEVGFASKLPDETISLKYYSAEREVEFCGHATIAIMYDLIHTDPVLAKKDILPIVTNMGRLEVYNRLQQENAVYISAPEPVFVPHSLPETSLANALGITIDQIDKARPIAVVNAGLNTLLVPIKSLDDILAIDPDVPQLKVFCQNNAIDIIEVFTSDVYDSNNQYRTRVFAPTFGYLEDPATGSGNSALGYYLRKNHLWSSEILNIEQNNSKVAYNSIKLKVVPSKNSQRILFGGPAIVRIEGHYFLT